MLALKKMRIQQKMLLFILSISLVIYLISFGYIITSTRQKALDDAERITATYAREYANLVKNDLNYDFELTRAMGWVMQTFKQFDYRQVDATYNPMMKEFIQRNPNFYSVWVSWELNSLLPDYTLPHGRVRHTYYREGERIAFKTDTLNLDGDNVGSLYHQLKLAKTDAISDPYWYSYSGREEDQVLEVSPCIPILYQNQFAGLAGTDIVLERFQELIMSLKPFEEGYVFLISHDGSYVGHPNPSFVGAKIQDIRTEYNQDNQVLERIQAGGSFAHYAQDELLSSEAYIVYAPIVIGNTQSPWSVGIAVPRTFILSEANRIFTRSLIFALLGLLGLSLVIYLIARNITQPLAATTQVLHKIAVGDISGTKALEVKNEDEIGEMAMALNKLLNGLKNTAEFALNIGQGKLNTEFQLLGQKDDLGNALINMRDSLQKAHEEEIRRKHEDERRSWVTQGQARFAEILRMNTQSMEELSFHVVKSLVKYLGAIQGGLFVLNDENPAGPYLELTACYAYDRRKYITKRIEMGEGMVGACFQERKSIYITQVPQDYVYITSGLGGENPSSLLIVPLILNEEVYGVIELAAFKTFEKYEIEFVEKVGENIASTLSGVKVNMRTAYLLEQSQQQAEEMRAQEEEMRQNMEEMHATQEEMARKEQTLQAQSKTMDLLFLTMEYDAQGYILRTNANFEKAMGYTLDEIKGKHISIFFDNPNWEQSKNYLKFWELLRNGQSVNGTLKRLGANQKPVIVKGVSNPIFNVNGTLEKVMEITLDITIEAMK